MTNRNHSLIAAIGCSLLLMHGSACDSPDEGASSGDVQTQSREVSAFDKVRNESSVNVSLKVQPGPVSLTLVCDTEFAKRVSTSVVDATLVIAISPGPGLSGSSGCSVQASTEGLTAASLSSSGNLELSGVVSAPISLSLSSSGNLDASNLSATDITVEGSSSGNMLVQASGRVTGSLSSSGNLEISGAASHDVQATSSGRVIVK